MAKRRQPAATRAATPMAHADQQTLEALRKASAGLLYPSESDAPFDVFQWPASGSAREQVAAHAKPGQAVEEVPVDTFFAELEGTEEAANFRQLRKILETVLTDVRVFRAGSVKVDVYVVGMTHSFGWVGLHTTSVET